MRQEGQQNDMGQSEDDQETELPIRDLVSLLNISISNFSQLFHVENSDRAVSVAGSWHSDNMTWRMTTSGPGSGARRRLNTDICCDKCFLGWLIITQLHTRSANQPGQMSRVSIVSVLEFLNKINQFRDHRTGFEFCSALTLNWTESQHIRLCIDWRMALFIRALNI